MAKTKAAPARTAALFLLAAAVGALGGVLGFAFQSLLRHGQLLRVAGSPDDALVDAAEKLASWQRVLVPAAGGLLAALLLLAIRGRRGPFGITVIMDLVLTRRGVIRLRDAFFQILSSACSLATGSSIGRESANSQLGATAASGLGALFGCSSRDRAVLLGCGVAAGMAISYNAPIAGALFVMEVVLGNFAMDVFAPIVVSAVIATLVNQALQPDAATHALYAQESVGQVHMADPRLVLAAVVLGCACGFGGVAFRHTLRLGARAFAALHLPLLAALPLGGAAVGVLGIWRPEVWGNGQNVVVNIITGERGYQAVGMVLTIMVLKSIATSLSLGSGALGGVFTPNLVVGAALGAVFGHGVAGVVPLAGLDLTAEQLRTGFALVGMAGLCAATAHAPITAVLLVFEFTRNYDLILPVMVCSIIGSLVARLLDPDSIFTARLRERGHTLAGGIEALAMQTNYVRDVMRADAAALPDTARFDDVMEQFASARRDTVYVLGSGGALLGRIHIHDVKFYINDPSLTSVVIAGDLTRPAPTVTREQSLAQVFHLFDDPDLEELPVVDGASNARLVGRLTRRDVIALLSDEVLGRRTLRAKLRAEDADEDTYVQLPAGAELARVRVPDALVGRAFDSLDLQDQAGLAVLVVIDTGADGIEHRSLPQPGKVLEAGSALVVLDTRAAIEAFGKAPAPTG